jgi:hypothetical protein
MTPSFPMIAGMLHRSAVRPDCQVVSGHLPPTRLPGEEVIPHACPWGMGRRLLSGMSMRVAAGRPVPVGFADDAGL